MQVGLQALNKLATHRSSSIFDIFTNYLLFNRDNSLNGTDDFVRLPFEGVDTLVKAFRRTVNMSGDR